MGATDNGANACLACDLPCSSSCFIGNAASSISISCWLVFRTEKMIIAWLAEGSLNCRGTTDPIGTSSEGARRASPQPQSNAFNRKSEKVVCRIV